MQRTSIGGGGGTDIKWNGRLQKNLCISFASH